MTKLIQNPLIAASLGSILILLSSSAHAAVVDDVLKGFKKQGATIGRVEQGKLMWTQTHEASRKPVQRSCQSCHSKDLSQQGKHVKTGKPIKPMAPSINAERLSDAKKIAKWFKRNCKWVLGRECTAQEKADVISYLRSL